MTKSCRKSKKSLTGSVQKSLKNSQKPEQKITSAQSLTNQYKQLEYEYRQLKPLADGTVAGMSEVMDAAQSAKRLYSMAVKGLYGDVSNAKTVTDDIYNRMAASGLSPEEWLTRETEVNQASKQGVGYLSDYQAAALKQVDARYQEVKNLQSQITGTEGGHQSMQLMNTQMNALLATTNQIVEQNAVMAQYIARKEAIDVGQEKAQLDGYQAWRDATKTSRKKTESLIEAIR